MFVFHKGLNSQPVSIVVHVYNESSVEVRFKLDIYVQFGRCIFHKGRKFLRNTRAKNIRKFFCLRLIALSSLLFFFLLVVRCLLLIIFIYCLFCVFIALFTKLMGGIAEFDFIYDSQTQLISLT